MPEDLDAYLAALIEVASEATPGKDGAPDDDTWGSMQAIVDMIEEGEKGPQALSFFEDDPQDFDGKPLSLDDLSLDAEFAWVKTGTKNKYGKPGWKNTETKKYIYQDSEPGSKKSKAPEEPKGAKPAAKEPPIVSSGKAAPEPKAPPATATEQPLTGPPKAPSAPGGQKPASPPAQPKPQATKLAPEAQKRLGELQSAQQKETSDPSHPINRLRDQLADARFSPDGPAIKTLRSTQDKPLTAQDHAAMSRMHARLGGILSIVGNKELSEANFAAARYHKGAAEVKQKAEAVKPKPQPDYIGKPIDVDVADKVELEKTYPAIYQHSMQVIATLDEKQKKYIKRYTGQEYDVLNAAMRKCPPKFDCVQGKNRKMMEAIESAIQKAGKLPQEATIYRGIILPRDKAIQLLDAAKQAQDKQSPFQMPSITSTSLRPDLAVSYSSASPTSLDNSGLVFHIKAKSGLYVAPISNHQLEKEILQSSQTKYRVAGISDTNFASKAKTKNQVRRRVIYLEEI